MFGLGVIVFALIRLPFVVLLHPLFSSSFLQYRGWKTKKKNILNSIIFYDLIKPQRQKEREQKRGREVGHTRASLNKEALCSPPTVSD